MKYLVKISNRALSHRFIFASLVSLNFILLILLLAGSCKKEAPQANNILPLTIGDAKLIYATLHSDYTPSDAVQRDDSTEAGHNTPLVIPDWEKAETYLDEKRQISVVEVPVVTHHIAKLVIVEGTADSSAVDGTTQLNKLVFTQDTSGAIRFALMKLVGTPGYLATHDITLNSFRHLDLDFQGFLGYYNLRDSLLKAFLFNEQDIFEVQSQPGNPGNGVQNAQDRWGYCIDHYEYRPCTSNQEHTWEQREQCKCGTEAAPNCTPPQRVPIYVICGVEVYLQGHIDEHGILPPRLPDNSLWITVGNGGGTVGGNTNQLSCLANAAKNFKDKYGPDLFSEAYEDMLYGCMANIDCHENEQVAFEECVEEGIALLNAFYPIPPNSPPITDMKSSLDNCFGISCNNCIYSITLFVEKPVPGHNDIYTSSGGTGGSSGGGGLSYYYTGHTFIELKQTKPTGEIATKGIGFYPVEKVKGTTEVKGFYYSETNNTQYNIKVEYQLNQSQFTKIRTGLENTYAYYSAGLNNCTTAPISVLNASTDLGIPLKVRHQWPVGQVNGNPGDLGEDLRADPRGGVFTSFPTLQNFSPSSCQD